MTENQMADEILIRFSLIKNDELEYIGSSIITKAASLICVKFIIDKYPLASDNYYHEQYWKNVYEIIKNKL